MKTTIPRAVVELLGITHKDKLNWCIDIQENGCNVSLEVIPTNKK